MDIMFSSVLEAADSTVSTMTTTGFMWCTVASIVLGLACALIYMYKHDYSKNFVVTLALLPVIVQIVITLVNGNLGAGIAVMGVFNLVRFRSIAGSAKDIGSVLLAMAIGLATGMGYIGVAAILAVVVGVFNAIYVTTPFAQGKEQSRTLKVTVPDDAELEGAFDGVVAKYADTVELQSISTGKEGSSLQMEYRVVMRAEGLERKMIDELCRLNGDLKISLGTAKAKAETL